MTGSWSVASVTPRSVVVSACRTVAISSRVGESSGSDDPASPMKCRNGNEMWAQSS